jgi:hypothetical protein
VKKDKQKNNKGGLDNRATLSDVTTVTSGGQKENRYLTISIRSAEN